MLFGSNEFIINDRGRNSFSGVYFRGARILEIPWPPIALISSMLACREPTLKGSRFGTRFLEKFTLSGFNLVSHMEPKVLETFVGLLLKGVQGLAYLNGSRLEALNCLAHNKNKLDGISPSVLLELVKGQYILKRDGSHYDFLDPQLLALECAYKGKTLEDAQGRVLELLVRNQVKDSFFRILEDNFPILKGLMDSKRPLLHGNVTKHCEMDGILFYNGCAVLLSCKRFESLQKWVKSFLDHLNFLSVEGERQCASSHKVLALSKCIILVACSVLDGDLAMKGGTYNHPDLCVEGSYQIK